MVTVEVEGGHRGGGGGMGGAEEKGGKEKLPFEVTNTTALLARLDLMCDGSFRAP